MKRIILFVICEIRNSLKNEGFWLGNRSVVRRGKDGIRLHIDSKEFTMLGLDGLGLFVIR